MRLWIATLLLAMFAFQTLPLAALGKAFAKAQWAFADDDDTADDEGDSATDSAVKLKKSVSVLEEDFLAYGAVASAFCSVQASRALFLHRADHLPELYAGEVATPPPNRC